ncbi:DUF397 domain-containing protein [Actinomadura sp. GTD37]|uniref:DUF397 domain-containing protein n=1 Tax=Actinomadura sp. GTD37 TaxID=1778030 RepID=UPI0035BF25C5
MDMSNVPWRKTRLSTENGGNCVELAPVSRLIAIRDSKDPDGPKLTLNQKEFRGLTQALKNL